MYETLILERDHDGIAWLKFNRPDKRNALNPRLLEEFLDALSWLEFDEETRMLVLTGVGDAWSAGMDLKEFFRDLDDKPAERQRVDHIYHLGWQRLNLFPEADHCHGQWLLLRGRVYATHHVRSRHRRGRSDVRVE